jgi:hypothetical protein
VLAPLLNPLVIWESEMELLIALYTYPAGFQPELLGWWMLWILRIGLPAIFLLPLAGYIMTRAHISTPSWMLTDEEIEQIDY